MVITNRMIAPKKILSPYFKQRHTGILALFAALALITVPEFTLPGNQLKDHPSPYLALHSDDPVHWQDWGPAVVKRAATENKLIFISSGYFSCHWCHVMQRESYSDPDVADLLHKLAIPVKIDRELQPALDRWLIDFTRHTTGQAGWPLNVFLTPDGYPLVGVTYLPKGRFSKLLGKLATRWREDEIYLSMVALNTFNAMQPSPQSYSDVRPERDMNRVAVKMMVDQAMQAADEIAGGFGEQNKFPMSPQIRALIEIQAVFPDERVEEFLKLTLDQIARRGLRDHLDGGFFRYTIDPTWDIPHFEKMLYDNAQLIDVYLRASEVLNQPGYLQVALDTLSFIMNHMHSSPGGYIASLSAVDNKNAEGGYYLWQVSELVSVLDQDELEIITTVFDIKGTSGLEAGHHLKFVMTLEDAAQQLGMASTQIRKTFSSARNKLRQIRNRRQLPADNKVLAAWNGLLLHSMSQTMMKTGDNRYREAAEKLYDYLSKQLWDNKQLYRFIHNGKAGGRVSLEDYAYVSRGIASWAKASANKQVWDMARVIALAGLQRFHNQNGWQLSEELLIPYNARELILPDSALPSASAALLGALLDIADQQQDRQLRQSILPYINVDLTEMTTTLLPYGSHILLMQHAL